MLRENFKKGDIIVFKLVSGEEIITELVNVEEQGYYIKNPINIVLDIEEVKVNNPNNENTTIYEPKLNFLPFLLGTNTNNKSYFLKNNFIMISYKAEEEASINYKKLFNEPRN